MMFKSDGLKGLNKKDLNKNGFKVKNKVYPKILLVFSLHKKSKEKLSKNRNIVQKGREK